MVPIADKNRFVVHEYVMLPAMAGLGTTHAEPCAAWAGQPGYRRKRAASHLLRTGSARPAKLANG